MMRLAVLVDSRMRAPRTEPSAPVPTDPPEVSTSASGVITNAASASPACSAAIAVSSLPVRSGNHLILTSRGCRPASARILVM